VVETEKSFFCNDLTSDVFFSCMLEDLSDHVFHKIVNGATVS
jgi:hypothetical protein